jgi:hypothetical protein
VKEILKPLLYVKRYTPENIMNAIRLVIRAAEIVVYPDARRYVRTGSINTKKRIVISISLILRRSITRLLPILLSSLLIATLRCFIVNRYIDEANVP